MLGVGAVVLKTSSNVVSTKPTTNTVGSIEESILSIRGLRVILDRDLAEIYGVETKVLNRAISRNRKRFPVDFAFRLTRQEFTDLRCQIGTSSSAWGGSRYAPLAFTEHGAIMAANVLRSPRATEMSVFVVRAFVKMREHLLSRAELEARLTQIENVLLAHDDNIRELYRQIRPLLLPPPDPPAKRIGFHVRERKAAYRTPRAR